MNIHASKLILIHALYGSVAMKAHESKELESKISTLISHVRGSPDYNKFVRQLTVVQGIMKRTADHMTSIGKLLSRKSTKPREGSLVRLFVYIVVAEGGYSSVLDAISLMLISDGHDLYIVRKFRYAGLSTKDLRQVDMAQKLQFLEKHGFSMVTKDYDKALRNRIAHHEFEVDDRGVVHIGSETVDIGTKLSDLIGLTNSVLNLINKCTHS